MNESVIEQFASTPEGKALLDEAEKRLSAEWSAMGELREAAVLWYRLHGAGDCEAFWNSVNRLRAAAKVVVELDEQ